MKVLQKKVGHYDPEEEEVSHLERVNSNLRQVCWRLMLFYIGRQLQMMILVGMNVLRVSVVIYTLFESYGKHLNVNVKVLILFIQSKLRLLSDIALYEIVNVASRLHGVRSSLIQKVIVPVPTAAVPKRTLFFVFDIRNSIQTTDISHSNFVWLCT